MNKQDRLWKAILEEFFYEFLLFHYPKFAKNVDVSKGFEFLDKDLPKIIPEAKEIHRKADKVVKVFLKDGTEQWIIVHVEVQGYKDDDFARRMFIYYYRLWEKFGKPIASLVIYSDKNEQNRANQYKVACLNTSLVYNFDTYVIADHTVAEYDKMDNPMAIIYQVALMGLQKNLADEELLEMKVQLFRKMYEKGYPKKRIRRLATFIKQYVHFSKPEYFSKFDEKTIDITYKTENMGIIETVKQIEREEAIKATDFCIKFRHSIDIIRSLFEFNMSNKDIAKVVSNIEESFVNELHTLFDRGRYGELLKKVDNLRKKIKGYYYLQHLKMDLATILLTYNFTEEVISNTLKISPKKVKTLKNKLTKKII